MSGRRGRTGSRPGRSAWPFLVVAVGLLASACSPAGAPTPAGSATVAATTRPAEVVAPPDTAAGAQLRWLLAATARLPVSDGQVRAHFDAAFLAEDDAAVLNQSMQAVTGAEVRSIQVSELNTVVAIVSARAAAPTEVWLTVDSRGLISELRISPATTGPTPATLADVDAALRSVAPQVRLLVADVSNGSCRTVHSIDPGTAAPIGAAFKLYVLAALGHAVASGTVRWNQPLTVTAQLKSLPAGELQNEPDGTQVSVLDTAAAMTSLSDNTATDMLINLVGRSAVEDALTTTGMANPALDRPLLRPARYSSSSSANGQRSRSVTSPRTSPAAGRCSPAPSTGPPFQPSRRQDPGSRRATSTASNISPRPAISAGPRLPRRTRRPARPVPDRSGPFAQRRQPGP